MAADHDLRILIVDNHDIARKGLAMLVSRQNGLSVVAEAGTAADALKKVRESVPDVVVMDTLLPDGSGIEVCREIRDENPNVKVLMLTSYGDQTAVVESIMAGASGYIFKKAQSQEISDVIRKADIGQPLIDPTIIADAQEHIRNRGENAIIATLTDQEQKILELMIEGQTNRKIASVINLRNDVIRDYVSNILGKLEISIR